MAARNRQKLIVIDDDQSSLDLTHQISQICTDLQVLGVDNIGEAVCYLKLYHYDCALVGSRLVGTNGLDMIRRLMGGGDLDVPVVALLDADDGRAAAKALADGADGCLPKAAMTADALIAAVARAIERKSHTGRRPITVLMAVDDNSQRLALRRCFERTGLDVRLQEATDAEACARLLDECSFDCMLLGNDLGELSGLELLSRLHSERKQAVPVVMLTGGGPTSDAGGVFRTGVQDSLSIDGLTPDTLEAVVTAAVEQALDASPLTDGRVRILVVDDDQVSRQAVRRTLQRTSLDVELHEAADAASCMSVLVGVALDCLLLDYRLPGRSGLDFLSMLRSWLKHTLPVIMLTGEGTEALVADSFHAGADDYIAKEQLSPARLESSIRRVIERASLRRQLRDRQRSLEVTNQDLRRTREDLLVHLREAEDAQNALEQQNSQYAGLMEQLAATRDELHHQALHDPLTQLPNRSLFHNRLSRAIAGARRSGGLVGALYMDLDDFKDINDTLGHPAGDKLLCDLAKRLAATVRESDTVARLGGDEFAILASTVGKEDELSGLADRVLTAASEPFMLDGTETHVGASIGITVYPTDSDNPDQLLKNADLALYRAKEAGKGKYQFFAPRMDAEVRIRKTIEADLRKGLQDDQFSLLYQPQIDLATGETVAAEALVRWHHAERTWSPSEFIPVAESTGLIHPIGVWVVHRACADAKVMSDRLGRPLRVSVNISPIQFARGDIEQTIVAALDQSGLAPELLELEPGFPM